MEAEARHPDGGEFGGICQWTPDAQKPCAHPKCPHGVSGFRLVVADAIDSNPFSRIRPRDLIYEREILRSGGDFWFVWREVAEARRGK